MAQFWVLGQSRALEDYLRARNATHLLLTVHRQTNGKLEGFHETLKARLNLLVFTRPEALRAAMAEFIEVIGPNHEGIGNITPTDVYYGQREEILNRRKE